MKTNVQHPHVTAYAEDETLISLPNIYSRHKHIKVGDKMMMIQDNEPTLVKIESIKVNGRIVYFNFDLLDLESCKDILVAVDLDDTPNFSLMDIEYFFDKLVSNSPSR